MARLGALLLAFCLAALLGLAAGTARACPHDTAEQAETIRSPDAAALEQVTPQPAGHSCPDDTRKAHACCAFPLALPDAQVTSLRLPHPARYPRPLALAATPLPSVPLDKPPKTAG